MNAHTYMLYNRKTEVRTVFRRPFSVSDNTKTKAYAYRMRNVCAVSQLHGIASKIKALVRSGFGPLSVAVSLPNFRDNNARVCGSFVAMQRKAAEKQIFNLMLYNGRSRPFNTESRTEIVISAEYGTPQAALRKAEKSIAAQFKQAGVSAGRISRKSGSIHIAFNLAHDFCIPELMQILDAVIYAEKPADLSAGRSLYE